ncbi:MAG: AAA family ATPase, partial [Proteobacteria bacterium]|nr:AAA family ATPase [Pseudomonadota bacterium]
MEKIITLQNRHWTKIYEGLIPRVCLSKIISKIKLKEIQVLLGVRRSGKSTLFKLIINHLIENGVDPKKILYLNFEDPFFSNVWKEPKLIYSTIEVAEKLTGERIDYLFLDEIQAVENWQSFIKSVYDSEVFRKIFITGSNSGLLKSDYSKMLSGRFVYDFVYPLSFKEICLHQNINNYLD